MPNEKPKIDVEITQEFGRLVETETRKIEPEEKTRRAIWALDTLKQEGRINDETTFVELVRTTEERKKELRQTIAYAKEIALSPATEDMSMKLNKVAKEEAATAERLVGYLEAVSSILMVMKTKGYDQEAPLSQIRERLKGELEIMETAVDRSEESRRHENK